MQKKNMEIKKNPIWKICGERNKNNDKYRNSFQNEEIWQKNPLTHHHPHHHITRHFLNYELGIP